MTDKSRPHILVLGAGASYGARTEPRPPLGNGLGEYLLRWLALNDPEGMQPDRELEMANPHSTVMPSPVLWQRDSEGTRELYDELCMVLQRAMEPSDDERAGFEREMDKLVAKNRIDLLALLHDALTWSMLTGRECQFAARQDLLDKLLGNGPLPPPTIIITLNYDMLTEEALERCGLAFHYPGLEEHLQGIALYKLHGSINWRQVKGYAGSHSLAVATGQARSRPILWSNSDRRPSLSTTETSTSYSVRHRNNLILELKQAASTQSTIMAVYGTNKPVAANPSCMTQHRRACRDHVAQAAGAHVTVIGVRLPTGQGDDPDLDTIVCALAQSAGTKVYVSPDAEDCARAVGRGFEVRQQTLVEFLQWPG